MNLLKTTSPDVLAFVEMNGGRLLEIQWEGSLAVFLFMCPDELKPEDFYATELFKFKAARNSVMDRLNQAKLAKKVDNRIKGVE